MTPVELVLLPSEPGPVVVLCTPFASGPTISRLWLQSDPDSVGAVTALALPTTGGGLAFDAVHALVGLALRSGGFENAELSGAYPLSWDTKKPSVDAQPVRGTLRDAVWSTAAQSESEAVLWVSGVHPPSDRTLEPGWWQQFDVLTERPHEVLSELHDHLAAYLDVPFAWSITGRSAAPDSTYVVQPEARATARLVPEADRVVLVVDLEQPAALVAEMLLHLCAHLALGHIRPGDTWGHWDTQDSLSPTPHRQWDREARAFVDEHFARPARRVSSLEECTPREKAWLVLFDHIGRMVGQQRTLHAETERYQAAAYAAHRGDLAASRSG